MQGKIYALFSILALSAAACGKRQSSSGIDSVSIAQTPVENQKKAGFCWAYATIGLVESDVKMRTQKELKLSEEAIAFYRMAEGLYQQTQTLSGAQLETSIREGSLEGWYVKINSQNFPDGLGLVAKYGVVPESVWNRKFTITGEVKQLSSVVKAEMLKLIDSKNPKQITLEEIIQSALLAPGAWATEPPKSFTIEGKVYTPHSYLKEIGFDPAAFRSVSANSHAEVDKVIAAAKRALVRGVSVPLGFPINLARLTSARFSGKGVDLNTRANFLNEGGHAVLITDFVNKNSKAGALPTSELILELKRPSADLSHFIFKNSWGANAQANESGSTLSGTSSGYYEIDREYILGSSIVGGSLNVVVPKDIALDPFGTETPNPAVAVVN